MNRIVWLFGDSHTMYTPLDPSVRLRAMIKDKETGEERLVVESEEAQLARYLRTYPAKLQPTNIRPDCTIRTPEEQVEYVKFLGDGAKARFAGLVTEEEYMNKFNNLRMFREAWTWKTPQAIIDIDMEKCRQRKIGDFRRQRAPLFTTLDMEYLRADEAKDEKRKQEIIKKKQELRDVTEHPALAKAKTPEELRDFIPECFRQEKS